MGIGNYEVVRSKRKSLSLTVTRDRKILVRAPLSVSEEQIGNFVMAHGKWIERRLAEMRYTPTFSDGSKILLLGQEMEIASMARAAVKDGVVYLPRADRERALESMLRRLTRERMQRMLLCICEKEPSLEFTKLTVTGARGRWGSCSSKKHISFSFRTAFLPDDLAYYLCVHELCHTLHMDHSAKFWAYVARLVPDYAKKRRALKSYLWAMNCL